MGKGATSKALEQQLEELNRLRATPEAPEARAAIVRALESARAPLVEAAANIVANAELDGFEPALRDAFGRFVQQPAKSDPRCIAKTSTVRALYKLSARAFDVFLRGIRYVQSEPAWRGSHDTAAELRGLSALGLVRGGYPDMAVELAELLADREPMARLAAVQAIAYSERCDFGLPLLRFKARVGDEEPKVTAACFSGLLALAPHGSLSFIESFLASDDEGTREAALLALGESRLPDALSVLRRVVQEPLSSEFRATALMAIALMRTDGAWNYLLEVVREEGPARARQALDALATYRREPSLRERMLSAVAARADDELQKHADQALSI